MSHDQDEWEQDRVLPPAPAIPAAQAPGAVNQDEVVRRTPVDWAQKLGHYHEAPPHMPQLRSRYDWQHAAADKLHGWSQQSYHYQNEPFLLSQADYEAALAAAAEYPAMAAHEAAIAPILKLKKERV
jgi:hypothetical protein